MSQPIYFQASGKKTRSKKRKLNDIAGGDPEGRRPLTKRKKITGFTLM